MESLSEQEVAKKFCLKAGKTATETVEMLRATCEDKALRRSKIFSWYGLISEGREEIQGDPRNGSPTESRTGSNIEKIRHLLL